MPYVPYVKQTWQDLNPSYPVSAARMGVLEQGIADISRAVPAYGTSLPASPVDWQEAILVDSLTNPTYQWRFRYNAGSTSPYKWEFVGGADAYVVVGASETTTVVGQWLDLATVGPRVILPRAGDYDVVSGGAQVSHSVAGATVWVAAYRGTAVTAAGRAHTVAQAAYGAQIVTSARFPDCPANDDLRLRYHNALAGTATFHSRWIRVQPVRVS